MRPAYGPLRRLLEKRAGGPLWLRLQTAMVLMLCFLCGILASHLALKAGMVDMRWRFPLTVVVAYAAFLLLVRLWLAMTGVADSAARIHPDHVEPARDDKPASAEFVEKAGNVADGVTSLGDVGGLVDAEGCLPAIGFVLFLAVLGFVLTVLWWFFGGFFGAASAALVEAGVEALLAIGMARVAGGSALGWVDGAVRASWKYWLALVGIAWAVAVGLHAAAPQARTLYQAVQTVIG